MQGGLNVYAGDDVLIGRHKRAQCSTENKDRLTGNFHDTPPQQRQPGKQYDRTGNHDAYGRREMGIERAVPYKRFVIIGELRGIYLLLKIRNSDDDGAAQYDQKMFEIENGVCIK